MKKHFVIVIGGAGSGKNYFIEHDPVISKYQLIDVDVLKKSMDLTSAIAHVKPLMKFAFEQGENVVHPTTGSHLLGQQNKIRLAKEFGYHVSLVFIDTSGKQAEKQVAQRVASGGHEVALADIEKSNNRARENFDVLRKTVDDSKIVSRSTSLKEDFDRVNKTDQEIFQKLYAGTRQSSGYNIPADYEVLGTGRDAVVIKHRTDGTVNKIFGSRRSLMKSGAMQYLLLCMKHSQTNPYLLKVYSIKQIPTANLELIMFAVQIEQLSKLDNAAPRDIDYMFRKIFTDEVVQDCRHLDSAFNLADTVTDVISDIEYQSDMVADMKLIETAKLISKISVNTGSGIDLHIDNMMVRYVNGKPQLVLNDPLYG